MAIKTLVRRFIKIVYFNILMLLSGHTLPPPEIYINYDFARKLSLFINDNESADSMHDAYSYIDLSILLAFSMTFYILTIMLINKVRNK